MRNEMKRKSGKTNYFRNHKIESYFLRNPLYKYRKADNNPGIWYLWTYSRNRNGCLLIFDLLFPYNYIEHSKG